MLYKVKFFPYYSCDVPDDSNEELIRRIVNSFKDESKILEEQRLLIYFGFHSSDSYGGFNAPKTIGTLKTRGSPDYEWFIRNILKNDDIEAFYPRFKSFEYIIYLTTDIRDSKDEIYRVFTIAHELEHVIQDIKHEYYLPRTGLLINYFHLMSKWSNEIYRNIPTEYDARRKAKLINSNIFGKKGLQAFIDDEIYKYEDKLSRMRPGSPRIEDLKNEKSYWEDMNLIDINKPYDLKSEFNRFWSKYKNKTEKEYLRIKRKRKDELSNLERSFIGSYEYYLKKESTTLLLKTP